MLPGLVQVFHKLERFLQSKCFGVLWNWHSISRELPGAFFVGFFGILSGYLPCPFHYLMSYCDFLVGVPIDEVKAHRAAQKIMEHLHAISKCRSNMKKYG